MTIDTPSQVTPDGAQTTAPPAQFYIPATSSILERRPRTLKHGDTFGVFDHYGNIFTADGSPKGLYHKDTRYLSDLRLLVNGRGPLLLSSTVQDNNTLFTADMTNPDFIADGKIGLARDTIHIIRSKFLWQSVCYERLGIHNFDRDTQTIDLAIQFGADFADIFEVRGHQRERRGETSVDVSTDKVVFTYTGLDNVVRRTVIRFDPAPGHIDKEYALFRLKIPPRQTLPVLFTIACQDTEKDISRPPKYFISCLRQSQRALRAATSRVASVETSNDIMNEVLCRTMADLYMLITETPHGHFPYAGIPWFSTVFGRDAIITAMEMLWIDPDIAKGVLKYLAATQAKEVNPQADAEPGKILHETRSGEMALLGEVPFAFYYGSVDSTPLFVMLAGMYFERTGDTATVTELWPHIEAALTWIDEFGDRDGDGFVEYHRMGTNGLVNQGWKDSSDSIFHADGHYAEGAIALCEVQGYVYAAHRYASEIAAALGFFEKSAKLFTRAEELMSNFEEAFWCEDIGTYALALDGRKRPCRVRSSNAGQLLLSGIVSQERAQRVADQLMGPDFFSGWGIRTISAREPRYNPMSYHNGSVWPHDNALIGLGFARYGLNHHLLRLFTGMFDTASYMDLRRLPELFCGFRRVRGKGPTHYPVACSPQAWSCAAPFSLLQASLGLTLNVRSKHIGFQQPRLPAFLDHVKIRKLSLGDSQVDLALHRYGTDVSVNVIHRTGTAKVTVTQ